VSRPFCERLRENNQHSNTEIEDTPLAEISPKSLHLSETERKELQLVNRYSTSQQIATRARIILLADDGQNHRQIARSWTSAEIWLALGVTDG